MRILSLLGLTCLSIFGFKEYVYRREILSENESIEFSIPKGIGVIKAEKIINQSIDQSGYSSMIVPYSVYFELYLKDRLKKIKAGDYRIEGPIQLERLSQILIEGQESATMPITIREGLNQWQIADLLQSNGILKRQDFLDEISVRAKKGEILEGKLFPDTYTILKKTTASEMIDLLLGNFEKKWAYLLSQYAEKYPQLKDEVVKQKIINLASLVEKEAQLSTEAPLIAKVFYNRLAKNMKLQTDPTCVYDEKYYLQKPSPELCKSLNPKYSTYLIEGLPPTPISNPGLNALIAAIEPSQSPESDEYLYFVAKQDGSRSHFFSKDYQSHQQAIDQFLKKKPEVTPSKIDSNSAHRWTGADVKKK
jgi:UPF0755 protein